MTKKQLTREQLIEKMKADGIIINNNYQAKKILQKVSYSRLNKYKPRNLAVAKKYNINLQDIYRKYEFDRQLRLLLLEYLEKIEISLRSQISYYHSHQYTEFGYLNADNHIKIKWHDEFKINLKRTLSSGKEERLLAQLQNNELPLEDAIDFFTFGMLSKFFNNMKTRDKKAISREVFNVNSHLIQSWLLCLTHLRNKCAHFSRLYNIEFSQIPHEYNEIKFNNTLFDYIVVLKFMLNDKSEWHGFVKKFNKLARKYKSSINLKDLGFPKKHHNKIVLVKEMS